MKRNKILFIFSLFFAFSASVLGQTSLKAKKLLDYQPANSIDMGYIKYISWYKKFWDNLR